MFPVPQKLRSHGAVEIWLI